MSLSANSIAAITAIVSLITAASTFIIPTIYNDIIKNPKIELSIHNSTTDGFNIFILNDGNEIAPFVLLSVHSQKQISGVELLSSISKVYWMKNSGESQNLESGNLITLNSNDINFNISSLNPGEGFMTKIRLVYDTSDSNLIGFSITSSFNGERVTEKQPKDPIHIFVSEGFKNTFLRFPFIGFIVLSIIIILYVYIYIPFIRNWIQKEFLNNIKKDALDIKKRIDSRRDISDLDYREIDWLNLDAKYTAAKDRKNFIVKYLNWAGFFDKRDILTSKDYLTIDNFYNTIEKYGKCYETELKNFKDQEGSFRSSKIDDLKSVLYLSATEVLQIDFENYNKKLNKLDNR